METGSAGDLPSGRSTEGIADRPPVVVLGASAGGLDAFTRFLDALPAVLGAAYVFLMHLDPERSSDLPALLRSHTEMPVVEAKDGTEIQPDHCYVPPPGAAVTVADGRLRASKTGQRRWGIDEALKSLATSVTVEGVELYGSRSGERVNLVVRPVDHPDVEPGLTLIVFEPVEGTSAASDVGEQSATDAGDRWRGHLEHDSTKPVAGCIRRSKRSKPRTRSSGRRTKSSCR